MNTKKGMASLYVVIFASILFGVITLSFVRIILSEASQSSNDDLSQSAYDSALAGVEDAKIAVNRYYRCLSSDNPASCGRLFNNNDDYDCNDFLLKKYLYPDVDSGEVKVQESIANGLSQAYTCVVLKNIVPDYRATLSSDTRTRAIPIGISATKLKDVKTIEFQWYSEINGAANQLRLNNDGKLPVLGANTIPPTISLTLLKTGKEFRIADFNNATNGDYSTMILLPSENGINEITQTDIYRAGDANVTNAPFAIKCGAGEFACTVRLTNLNFPSDGGNAMLIASMPYGDMLTDFAITLRDRNNNPIDLENVQISVDATGRANQLVRRVETRLDLADIFFPYPQYAVELTGGDDENSLWKNFWVTNNCWTDGGPCANNGNF